MTDTLNPNNLLVYRQAKRPVDMCTDDYLLLNMVCAMCCTRRVLGAFDYNIEVPRVKSINIPLAEHGSPLNFQQHGTYWVPVWNHVTYRIGVDTYVILGLESLLDHRLNKIKTLTVSSVVRATTMAIDWTINFDSNIHCSVNKFYFGVPNQQCLQQNHKKITLEYYDER